MCTVYSVVDFIFVFCFFAFRRVNNCNKVNSWSNVWFLFSAVISNPISIQRKRNTVLWPKPMGFFYMNSLLCSFIIIIRPDYFLCRLIQLFMSNKCINCIFSWEQLNIPLLRHIKKAAKQNPSQQETHTHENVLTNGL